jgi:pyridoxamine 5'-phosphate oxidase
MALTQNLADLRQHYTKGGLEEHQIPDSPFILFNEWFLQAGELGVLEPNAMVISTVSADNKPSSRVVLLKGIEDGGFIFYTNYESRKGKELEHNPYISVLFFWPEAERQIRIEGKVSKISTETSKAYFVSRPRESQLGAWASAQSSIIQGRHSIEESYQQCLAQYEGKEIPLPDFWGGYIIHPSSFEFWQGRPSRLHDRMKYNKQQDSWHIVRLSP